MWAFSDESERADRMLIGVVFVPTGMLDTTRTALRSLLLPGQRRIHTSDESPRRRRVLLDSMARLDVTAVVLRLRRTAGTDRVEARRRLMGAACAEVVGRRARGWTFDDAEPVQRARDRFTIAATLRVLTCDPEPVYDHRRSHTEPLLWVADALCWAVGAGGHWRRRVSGVVEVRDVP